MSLDSLNRKVGLKLDKSGGEVSGDLNVNGNLEAKSVLVNGFDISQIIPTGSVLPFAGTTAPQFYLICDGRAVSRTEYKNLFNVIGTSYGSGNGTSTFNLPDFRWSFLRGFGENISVTGTETASSNQAIFNSHRFNRTGVRVRLSSGTLSGLATSIDYFVIVVDSNTLAFATTKANALSNTRIAISGGNSAVIVQSEDPDASSRTALAPGGNSAANIASQQEDALQRITGSVVWTDAAGGLAVWDTLSGAFTRTGGAISRPNRGAISGSLPPILSFDSANVTRSSSETRPSNVYVNYIIKI